MVKKHYGLRTERYKLIHFYEDIDEWELYDLALDPKEMNNVYDEPEYQTIRNEMLERLNRKRLEYKETN